VTLKIESHETLIDARGLGRRHPNGVDWLLYNVSLQVRPGDRLTIVGATGTGKTLLLRALALLDPVETGEVYWGGTQIAPRDVPEFRSQVIYLHQRPALFDGTVEDNLRQPYSLSVHAPKKFDRVRTVARLHSVGRNENFLDRLTGDLSGGESQLVALLRALQLDPLVLLLDEATASLDPLMVDLVESLIAAWLSEVHIRAMVWVSHDAQQAGRVARRTIRMASGRIESEY
jgi:putative ABC transport system ATP-binding protein